MPSPERSQSNSVNIIDNSRMTKHVPGAIIRQRYQIIQELGQTGWSITYLAKDLELEGDSRCAIEQLAPKTGLIKFWQQDRQNWTRHLELLRRLGEHPQIPEFLAGFVEEERVYLVLEYIDGERLTQVVKRQVFDEAKAVHLLHDTLRILDFIHKVNLIHRDIKPGNLIYRHRDRSFVLTNLGAIAEKETHNQQLERTPLDPNIGTSGYMPPEQTTEICDFNSDIYALGKTIIYALTGKSPRKLEKTGIDWHDECLIGVKLKEIISKTIAVIPKERYQSALEILYDLKPLLKIERVVGGRYRITQHLGGNRQINTYLAENLRSKHQSPCVLHQIDLPEGDRVAWEIVERRFSEELSLLERLSYHDLMPQIWDRFEENEAFYLVREYIVGENIAQAKSPGSHWSEKQVLELLDKVLSVLVFLHQNQLIHRQIEPSSIVMRDVDRLPIVTNFGVITDMAAALYPNSFKIIANKRKYVPPEQLAGRPTVGSDLYALGITAIEALTGINAERLTRNSETGEIIWKDLIPFNRRLAKILDRMTHLDLGKRYQSAEKVIADLKKINLTEKRTISTKASSTPQQQVSGLRPLHLIIGVLGIICLLGSIEFTFPTIRPIYYWYRGKQLLETRPKTALINFLEALDVQPNHSLSWEGKGDALYRLNKFSEALIAYEEAIKLHPNREQTWYKKGDTLFRLEKFSLALIAYEKSLTIAPDNLETLTKQGKVLQSLKRYPESLSIQEKILSSDPLNLTAMSGRAHSLIGVGRYYDALGVFNRLSEIAPREPQLWQDKASALYKLGRPEETQRVIVEVIDIYRLILKQQPKAVNNWLAKGHFLTEIFAQIPQEDSLVDFHLQFLREAAQAYQRAISLKPDLYDSWLGLAKVAYQENRYDDALASTSQALTLQSESPSVWYTRGLILQNGTDRLTEALAAYEKSLQLEPGFAAAWHSRGLLLARQTRYDEAIESLQKAAALDPQDIESWLDLSDTYLSIDRNDLALKILDRALTIKPQELKLWQQKGAILTNVGKYSEACDTYRESRQIKADFSPILQIMQQLGCRLNKHE